jgi:hypothetical protein
LALQRFTRAAGGPGPVIGLSLAFWLVAPLGLALTRLRRADV